jgi:L-fuconolactonase
MTPATPADFDEPAIDPDVPVVDAHHHLWKAPHGTYLLDDLLADLATGHDVRATVYIEGGSLHRPIGAGGTMYRRDGPDAMKPVGETEFANGVGAMAASGLFGPTLACAGVVGFVDLSLGEAVAPILDAHMRSSRFRGIRHIVSWDADPTMRNPVLHTRAGLLADPDFRRGAALLPTLGLTFETTALHPQIPEVAAFARALPDLTVILCHLGYPIGTGRYAGRPAETFAEWRSGMADLATCSNVRIKLGGLLSPRCALTPPPGPPGTPRSATLAAAWAPFVETAIDLFGPDRCMFEANFPVDGRYASYRTVWNAFKRLAARHAPHERRRLLHDTAREVYRLDV